MKNRFQHAIAATALLALGFAAAPVLADAAADKVTSYVEIARSVFGGDKTAGDVVSATLAAAADKGVDAQGTVGELAAALSAAEVAKDDPAVADALAGIVSAVNDAAGDDAYDFASRAAAAVSAVTGLDIAGSLADEAFADAANDPDSVLDATEKADLKDLYEKVLAALKGAGYAMKEDGDKVTVGGKGKGKKGKKGKADEAAAAAASGAGAGDGTIGGSDGTDAGDDTTGGSDGTDDDGTIGGSDGTDDGDGTTGGSYGTTGGGTTGGSDGTIGGSDNLGDPVDQTIDNPHEYHPTPTTINGMNQPVLTPVVTPTTKPSKPKPTKPSPTPVGLR